MYMHTICVAAGWLFTLKDLARRRKSNAVSASRVELLSGSVLSKAPTCDAVYLQAATKVKLCSSLHGRPRMEQCCFGSFLPVS